VAAQAEARTVPMPGAAHGPLLEVAGASKAFPGAQALDNMSFDHFSGEVHALAGQKGTSSHITL